MKQIIKLLYILPFLLFTFPAMADGLPGYRLGPGDVLQITVWKEDGLDKEILVRPDGGISFPLVGELQAGGRTTADLRQELVQKLKRFIPDPVIDVSLRQLNNNKIYVVGKVNRPGEFAAPHYMDVMQALAMAGGLTSYASSGNIKVLRRVNGKEQAIPFDYGEVAGGDNLKQNIILNSGDVVVVP